MPNHALRLTPADADALVGDLVVNVDEWHEWETVDGLSVDVRLTVVPDDVDRVQMLNDDDFYGRVAWGRFNRYHVTCDAYGRTLRPDGFDGNAEIIQHNYPRDVLWWQPPADVPRTSEHFASLRSTVRDLVEYGYVGYVVDVRTTIPTAWGDRTVKVATASLWGIDTHNPREYPSAVADLVAECFEVLPDHEWQTGRFTGAVTCSRCGLLPLDDDRTTVPCIPDD